MGVPGRVPQFYHSLEGWLLALSPEQRQFCECVLWNYQQWKRELVQLERSEQLLRRKELYEARWPETRAEERRKLGMANLKQFSGSEIISSPDALPVSFAADTAAKTGSSPRSVQQDVQIATKIFAPKKAAGVPQALGEGATTFAGFVAGRKTLARTQKATSGQAGGYPGISGFSATIIFAGRRGNGAFDSALAQEP
jgi:hypothetical protein